MFSTELYHVQMLRGTNVRGTFVYTEWYSKL